MANEYLKYIHTNIEQITHRVEDEFGSLSEKQINWKETDKRWSIAECLDHIMTTNQAYYPQFEDLIQNQYEPTFWTKMPKAYHLFWSGKLKERMTPQVTKRSIAPPVFQPEIRHYDCDIIAKFKKQQKVFLQMLDSLPLTPHDMIIISSPAARFITYPLRDAIEILSSHEVRHFNQAHRITDLLGFPTE